MENFIFCVVYMNFLRNPTERILTRLKKLFRNSKLTLAKKNQKHFKIKLNFSLSPASNDEIVAIIKDLQSNKSTCG